MKLSPDIGALIMARMKFLTDNFGVGKIIEQHHNVDMSEFVSETGGDVTKYRVYGDSPETFFAVCK